MVIRVLGVTLFASILSSITVIRVLHSQLIVELVKLLLKVEAFLIQGSICLGFQQRCLEHRFHVNFEVQRCLVLMFP